MIDYLFKNRPEISDEVLAKCRKTKNYTQIAFEWAKYVGVLCVKFATIDRNSPGVKDRQELDIIIIQGLLNRCSRLFYSIIFMGAEKKFDETIRIVFRCIIETLFTIKWLIKYVDKGSFKRYLRSSLDGDREFELIIREEIKNRGSDELVIEKRMLKSIEKSYSTAGMTPKDFSNFKKMPNLRQICMQLGEGDMAYVSMMRMSSHAVHGTWTDLIANYLEMKDGHLQLRDSDKTSPGENYYTVGSIFAIEILQDYIAFLLAPHPSVDEIQTILKDIFDNILEYRDESWRDDYSTTKNTI